MIQVLYVDDETALLDLTKIYLEDSGDLKVDTTTSPLETISLLQKELRCPHHRLSDARDGRAFTP